MIRLEPAADLREVLARANATPAADAFRELTAAIAERAQSIMAPHSACGNRGPLRVTKSRLADVNCCERLTLARLTGDSLPGGDGVLLEGMVLSRLAGGNGSAVDAAVILDELGQPVEGGFPDGPELEDAVGSWCPLPNGWDLGYQVRTCAVLATGRLEFSTRPDLTLRRQGRDVDPTSDRVVIIELKSGGEPRYRAEELAWYALVHLLRHGTAPAAVALWTAFPRRGASSTWHMATVDENLLRAMAGSVLERLPALVALAMGRAPTTRPGMWCRFCPEAPHCPVAEPRAVGHLSGRPADEPDNRDPDDFDADHFETEEDGDARARF